MFNPVYLQVPDGAPKRDNIEATRSVGMYCMAGEIVLRGARDPSLLVCINTFRGGPEAVTAPITYFDENDGVLVLHHKIDFAAPAGVIARQ